MEDQVHVCPVCGTSFLRDPNRPQPRQYCSLRCRGRSARVREKKKHVVMAAVGQEANDLVMNPDMEVLVSWARLTAKGQVPGVKFFAGVMPEGFKEEVRKAGSKLVLEPNGTWAMFPLDLVDMI